MSRFSAIYLNIANVFGSEDVYSRGLSHHIDEDMIASISKSTKQMTRITPAALSTGSPISKVASSVGSAVNVSGGWSADRCVIVLLVKDTVNNDMIYVTAFTDPECRPHADSTHVNRDCNIRLNTVTRFHLTPVGNGAYEYVGEAADLALGAGNYDKLGKGVTVERAFNARPKDLLNNATYTGDGTDGLQISAIGSEALAGGLLGSSLDTSPLHVMSKSLMAIGSAASIDAGGLAIPSNNNDERAENIVAGSVTSGSVQENSLIDQPFLEALMHGEGANVRTQKFTFQKLFNLLPNLKITSAREAGYKRGKDLSSWKTHLAGLPAEIANSLTGQMIHAGIQSCEFAFTNLSRDKITGHDHQFIWTGGENSASFINNVNINAERAVLGLESSIRSTIIPTVCRGRKVTCSISCNISSDLTIEMEVDGVSMSYVDRTWALAIAGVVVNDEKQVQQSSVALYSAAKLLVDINAGSVGSGVDLSTRSLSVK